MKKSQKKELKRNEGPPETCEFYILKRASALMSGRGDCVDVSFRVRRDRGVFEGLVHRAILLESFIGVRARQSSLSNVSYTLIFSSNARGLWRSPNIFQLSILPSYLGVRGLSTSTSQILHRLIGNSQKVGYNLMKPREGEYPPTQIGRLPF